MLKFADLSVDMKSYENSLDSYMKLFPGSYMPLFIMYLSHEGLLKLGYNLDENSPQTIISVTREEIANFFDVEESNIINFNGDKSDKKDLESFIEDYFNQGDFFIMKSTFDMRAIGSDVKSLSLYIDGSHLDKIKDILLIQEGKGEERAARLFFYLMIMSKFPFKGKMEDEDLRLAEKDEDYARIYKNVSSKADKMFCDAFDDMLSRCEKYAGDKTWKQPQELTRVILSQYDGRSMYNPFAGLGSYITENQRCWNEDDFTNDSDSFYQRKSLGVNYCGDELNAETWAIGKLRQLSYGIDSDRYILGDSTKWRDEKYCNVFSTPPFGLKIINENGKPEYADNFVIRHGIESITDDGMVACVVPVSFFNRKDSFDLRKKIVDEGFLSEVVFLPDNLFPRTNIATAIIFIRKPEHNWVKFVNATNCLDTSLVDALKDTLSKEQVEKLNRLHVLDIARTANLIEHDDYPGDDDYKFAPFYHTMNQVEFNSSISKVPLEFVANFDYDLSPANYFESLFNVPDGFKTVPFADLVTEVSEKAEIGMKGKLVTGRSLLKDTFLPFINSDNLEDSMASREKNFKVIDKKALVLSSVGELRPSLVLPLDGQRLMASPNILVYYLNDKVINGEYLVGELNKDYVKEQLRLRYAGSALRRLSSYDVRCLKIIVPDNIDFLKAEEDIVVKAKEEFYAKLGLELVEKKSASYDEYVKMLRQRKHRIQQIMNEFSPAFALLDKCRVKNGGILHDSDVVAARTGETVDSYFNKLHIIVDKVEKLVTNLVDKENWEGVEQISIEDFVNEIPKQHISEKYTFQVHINRDVEIFEEGEIDLNEDRIVKANRNDLSIVFENIIANAVKWGFTESTRRDYTIRIEVFDGYLDNLPAVRICISNNGTAIHPSVDRDRFFEWGYGTGTGIGTWQLKDIIEHYDGTIRLNEYPDEISGFQTEYEIVLPLINND